MPEDSATTRAPSASLAWRRRLIVATSILVAVSIGARVSLANKQPAPPPGATSLTADTQQPQQEPTGIQKLLPFVTEAGVAFLIGIFAGIATRMVAKVAIAVVLLGFLGLQFLAYKGLINVDWGKAWIDIRDYVLNISDSSDLGSIAKHKVPSIAAFVMGYVLGLKR